MKNIIPAMKWLLFVRDMCWRMGPVNHNTCFTLDDGKRFIHWRGWSGGAKVLGKLSVPGRPTNLEYSRARAYCSCSRCGWGLCGHFFSRLSFLSSFSLSLGDGPI